MSEHERDAEEQVEDLDVPESEGEDVKGGAFDAFNKANNPAVKIDTPGANIGVKLNPGGLNYWK